MSAYLASTIGWSQIPPLPRGIAAHNIYTDLHFFWFFCCCKFVIYIYEHIGLCMCLPDHPYLEVSFLIDCDRAVDSKVKVLYSV